MEGLVKEAESVIEDTEEGTSTRDVALIIAAQKVEHYEIAAYGGFPPSRYRVIPQETIPVAWSYSLPACRKVFVFLTRYFSLLPFP